MKDWIISILFGSICLFSTAEGFNSETNVEDISILIQGNNTEPCVNGLEQNVCNINQVQVNNSLVQGTLSNQNPATSHGQWTWTNLYLTGSNSNSKSKSRYRNLRYSRNFNQVNLDSKNEITRGESNWGFRETEIGSNNFLKNRKKRSFDKFTKHWLKKGGFHGTNNNPSPQVINYNNYPASPYYHTSSGSGWKEPIYVINNNHNHNHNQASASAQAQSNGYSHNHNYDHYYKGSGSSAIASASSSS